MKTKTKNTLASLILAHSVYRLTRHLAALSFNANHGRLGSARARGRYS